MSCCGGVCTWIGADWAKAESANNNADTANAAATDLVMNLPRVKVFSCELPAHSSAWTAGLPLHLNPEGAQAAGMAIRLGKRQVYLLLAALVVLVAGFVYPRYFDWWDHDNCAESGGTWDEAHDKCVEPRNADIPNTSKTPHDEGAVKPSD